VRGGALVALVLVLGTAGCGVGRRVVLFNDTGAPVVVPGVGRDGADLYVPASTRARLPVPEGGELVVRIANRPRRYRLVPLPGGYLRRKFPYGSEECFQIGKDLRMFAVPAGQTFPARPPGPQPPGYPLRPAGG
jgi:hypothetical protein